MCLFGRISPVIVFAARKLNVTWLVVPDMTRPPMSDAMPRLFLNHFTPPWLYPVNMHCCLSPCVPGASILRGHILFFAATYGSVYCKYTCQQPLLSIITRLLSRHGALHAHAHGDVN
ncbi:hypothetical protein COCMIDRAFT_91678 [Bipolaris oryzae ATCC 44560]|uniref:Uncharacterized protein n=1 Tax=Bipolaris oryzae ATCC 44560 TaxID=930090 RepID=W6ZT13_COCMI|nr:uncharacterized protein COCMIDRAFT_91678 [Bipolaris oryzae ATCC 44560]EUC46841.1 hypothetical protein COCMIDRAFT_91678 [Bipolaris oryzae ATCC 44560]